MNSPGPVPELAIASRLRLHHFHAVADRLAPTTAPLPLRSPHLVAEVVAGWSGPTTGAPHRAWSDRVAERLSRSTLRGAV